MHLSHLHLIIHTSFHIIIISFLSAFEKKSVTLDMSIDGQYKATITNRSLSYSITNLLMFNTTYVCSVCVGTSTGDITQLTV